MSISAEHLHSLAKRLKANYEECEIAWTGNILKIQLPMGEVQVSGNCVSFFAAGAPFDQLNCENLDELYEEIEFFIFTLREEEKKCNPTFNAASENAGKRSCWVLYASVALVPVLLLGYCLLDLSWIVLVLVLLIPVAVIILMRLIRLYSFHRDWICPHCGAKLPLETGRWMPQMKSVSRCCVCNENLLDSALMAQLKQQVFSEHEEKTEEEIINTHTKRPKRGGTRPCRVWGILLLTFALFFGALMFVDIEQVALAVTAVNAVTLLLTAAAGAALLRCRAVQQEGVGTPKIIVCEQNWLPAAGIVIGILGLLSLFISFALSSIENASLGSVVLFALLGLSFVGLSVWMLLARKNRVLLIYASRLIYVTSFGHIHDIALAQIASVRATASRSVQFLDQDGKKLFSIETNMAGADQVIDWIGEQKFSIHASKTLEKQVEQSANQDGIVSWREEYRTPLHAHLGAIRVGLVLVISLFAAGCVVPLLLYPFTDLKMSHAIYLTTISPLPMVLYYIIFAPVLMVGDRPAGATDEWRSMHIKFPITLILILDLLISAQVFYFWDKYMLHVVDFGRFFILETAFTVGLMVLFWIRTPKRLHTEDFVMLILSLVMLGYVMTYGANLAISRPVEHYPAVVVDRSEPTAEDEDAERTLTVLLDDGTAETLNVSERLYDLEEAGVEVVVCQKENFFGIRMVRLHLPKDVDLSAFLEAEATSA